MSKPEKKTATPPLMARLSLTADEWADVRMLAFQKQTTTQQLLADIVRAHLAEEAAA